VNKDELVAKLKLRVEEERLAFRVETDYRDYGGMHGGKADGFSEVLELLGEPFDPLAGKPHLW
jgi:hypothetical protein